MSLIKISLCYGIVVLGMLVLMRTGLVSFGHGLYFCLGAYAAAAHDKLANLIAGIGESSSSLAVRNVLQLPKMLVDAVIGVFGPYDIAVMLGFSVLVTGLTAWILGFLLRKYRDIFFAMLSLAFSMILYGSLVKTSASDPATASTSLPRAVRRIHSQDQSLRQAIFVTMSWSMLSALLINFYLPRPRPACRSHPRQRIARGIHGRIGTTDSSTSITSFPPVSPDWAARLMAITIGHIDPEMAYWTTSGEFVFVAILAGTGNVLAPFLGAFIFETIRSFAYEYSPNTWQMALGITMLLVILFLPGGLWSLFQKMRRKAA